MILDWVYNMIFGKREKVTMVINVTPRVASKVTTVIDLFNSKNYEHDHIDHDDVCEIALDKFCNEALKLNYEEDDLPSTKPRTPIHVEPTVIIVPKKRNAKPIKTDALQQAMFARGRTQAK